LSSSETREVHTDWALSHDYEHLLAMARGASESGIWQGLLRISFEENQFDLSAAR
jgi:hypothetical protein